MNDGSHPRRIHYGGEVWWLCKSGYYCNTDGKKLHRQIYEDNFGPIPSGYVVHHRDHDRRNNSPENLETMPRSAHTRYHQTGRTIHPNQLAASSAEMHRRWASAPVHRVICLVCSAPFGMRSLQAPRQFCSDRCQDRWRANRFAGEPRNCDHCGQGYLAVRRVQWYCSKVCNSRATPDRHSNQSRESKEIVCSCCGQQFVSRRLNARFCGRDCAVKYHGRRQHRRKVSAARSLASDSAAAGTFET